MSLLDELLEQTMPQKKNNLCIDQVAKDLGQAPSEFREGVRKNLFLAGEKSADEIDQAFMEAVKNTIAKREGSEAANREIKLFQSEKECR